MERFPEWGTLPDAVTFVSLLARGQLRRLAAYLSHQERPGRQLDQDPRRSRTGWTRRGASRKVIGPVRDVREGLKRTVHEMQKGVGWSYIAHRLSLRRCLCLCAHSPITTPTSRGDIDTLPPRPPSHQSHQSQAQRGNAPRVIGGTSMTSQLNQCQLFHFTTLSVTPNIKLLPKGPMPPQCGPQ